MKKWYQKGICLVLIFCLLVLTACNSKPTGESTQTTKTTEQQQPAGSQDESATSSLNWKAYSIENLSYKSSYREMQAHNGNKSDTAMPIGYIHQMTYETWKEWSDYRISWHTICEDCGYCYRRGTFQNPVPCLEGEFFQKHVYSQEYFAENALLLLDVEFEYATGATFKGIRYENNVLTCVVERPKLQPCSRLDNQVILVEIDSVLPEDTELKIEYIEIEESATKPSLSSLPKTLAFTWKDFTVYQYTLFEHSFTHYFQGSVYGTTTTEGGHTFTKEAAISLDLEGYELWKKIADVRWYENALAGMGIKDLKAYLKEDGLIIINLKENSAKPFALSDVSYKDGVVTCSFTFYEPPEQAMAGAYYERDFLIFVATDTQIPKGAEIKIERTTVTLKTEAEFEELLSQQRNEIEANYDAM